MTEDYIEKTCEHCKKKFNWEYIGYQKDGQYFCGRVECEKEIKLRKRT